MLNAMSSAWDNAKLPLAVMSIVRSPRWTVTTWFCGADSELEAQLSDKRLTLGSTRITSNIFNIFILIHLCFYIIIITGTETKNTPRQQYGRNLQSLPAPAKIEQDKLIRFCPHPV
jgi:hypothetical protein